MGNFVGSRVARGLFQINIKFTKTKPNNTMLVARQYIYGVRCTYHDYHDTCMFSLS